MTWQAQLNRQPRLLRWSLCAMALSLGATSITVAVVPRTADAAIIERIVAVVGQDAILLSELKERCMPFLLRIYASVPEGPARTANISQVYQFVLQAMIDERLEEDAARKAGIEISDTQVDEAIEQTAAQNGMSVNQILAEAKRSGLSIRNYREELRRQLIQRGMMEFRLRGRVNITENDLRASYRQIAIDERMQQPQRTLALRIYAGSSDQELKESRVLAQTLSNRARNGENFRDLIDQYANRPGSGLRPELPPFQEPKEIQRATMALEVGETSLPVRDGADWLILQVIERPPSQLPSYNEARAQIHERVYMEKMTSARKHWLDGLRRRTHVEVRL